MLQRAGIPEQRAGRLFRVTNAILISEHGRSDPKAEDRLMTLRFNYTRHWPILVGSTLAAEAAAPNPSD